MSLQFILGRSGCGKSYELYRRVLDESMKNPQTNYLVIVPEQATMETQKDFVRMHKNHGIMNIDVSSFMRLARRIMEETGKGGYPVLEDTGKNMVLRRVLEEKKEELNYFKSNIRKTGFVDEMKSMLSELYQYSIGEEELAQMMTLAEKKPALHAKLKDIYVIYCGFRDFLKEKYITAEEIMEVFRSALEDSEIVRNSVICLDGFTGFTPSQYPVLRQFLRLAKKVYVTVTIDEREDLSRVGEEFEFFHMSKKTIHKLGKIAFDEKIEVLDPVFPKKNKERLWRFHDNEALGELEKNIFRTSYHPYSKKQESIFIDEMENPAREVLFVTNTIKRLIRTKGYRYRDFAVVTGAAEEYRKILEQGLINASIPYFLDDKREITKNPLIVFINSLFSLAEGRLDYESMFHYLRSPMLKLDGEEVDRLENYCLALGIRGKKAWFSPFVKVCRDMEEKELDALNALRETVVNSLCDAQIFLEGKSQRVEGLINGLYDFLVSNHTWERLEGYRVQFEEEGDYISAKEYEQVYPIVMQLLERMIELLGDETVSIKEFRDILNAGFMKAKAGFIPGGIDQVLVGDIERTRLKDIKVLFFIGVNDGIIPGLNNSGGLLSDMERELLKSQNVELAPTRREKIYTERFYLYLNLTKPKDRVYLVYSKVGMDGKARKPSYLIGKIRRLFPLLTVGKEEEIAKNLEYKIDADRGKECLIKGIRDFEEAGEEDPWFPVIYSWYFENADDKTELIKMIDVRFLMDKHTKISRAAAKALYGETLSGSVTRLEQFAACACAHFLQYGLKLRERQEFKLNMPDMGNIFHKALELFSEKLRKDRISWKEVGMEEQEKLAEECVREVAEEYGNTVLKSSKRNEYIIKRIMRILKRTLWALVKQLSAGSFEPAGYELSFSYLEDLESVKPALSDGSRMHLNGRIDRVDLCENEDEIYVKVIDYKSGKKTFDIVDVYYGLELQLIVYMGAMLEKTERDYPDKIVSPAGAFYFNIDDPLVEKDGEESTEDAMLKELRMNGLVNERKEIITALDKEFSAEDGNELRESVKSKIIPVETVKSGGFSKSSNIAATKEFKAFISYANEKMKEFGDRILDGECERNPYKAGERTACDYCMFSGACGFDKKMPDHHFRLLEKLNKEAIFEKLTGREEDVRELDERTTAGD